MAVEHIPNYVAGRWQEGSDAGSILTDPVTGENLVTVSSCGIDMAAGLTYAREVGSVALQGMHYAARAALLGNIAEVLSQHREAYFELSHKNLGTTRADASFDVDGAIFTLKSYARAGKSLGEARHLNDGATIALGKTDAFQGQHYLIPLSGVAIFINAFNFPAWGLWEKAAPALLSGMSVWIKPATPTAWLTQRMVRDVIQANILPDGALSIVCGAVGDLLDHVLECDVVSFTGSAQTAERIRSHSTVIKHSVRVNIEADSLNAAVLGPDVAVDSPTFELCVKEVVREMTLKTGQKCTAIRRIFAPQSIAQSLADAIAAQLAGLTVGNPRHPDVQVGPLVSAQQRESALSALAQLRGECSVVFGDDASLIPAYLPNPTAPNSAFLQPTLLFCEQGENAQWVHDIEVFGPVATVIPYQTSDNTSDTYPSLIAMIRRGRGSLVASLYSDAADFIRILTLSIADLHGRIVVINQEVGNTHSGHGNVLPNCLHGGAGRAGGGEELGGLRALLFYHRRFVLQAPKFVIESLKKMGTGYV